MDEKKNMRCESTMEAYSKVKNDVEIRFVANYINFSSGKTMNRAEWWFAVHSSTSMQKTEHIFMPKNINGIEQ